MVLLQQDSVSKFNLLGYIKRVLNGSESQKSWIKRWVGRYNLEGFIRPMRVGGSIKLGMGIMIHMTQAGPLDSTTQPLYTPTQPLKRFPQKPVHGFPPRNFHALHKCLFFSLKKASQSGRKEGKFQTFFPSL